MCVCLKCFFQVRAKSWRNCHLTITQLPLHRLIQFSQRHPAVDIPKIPSLFWLKCHEVKYGITTSSKGGTQRAFILLKFQFYVRKSKLKDNVCKKKTCVEKFHSKYIPNGKLHQFMAWKCLIWMTFWPVIFSGK
jgi:hypothetical protein